MATPPDIPLVCAFAEHLIVPRIERVEADVANAGRDLDAAHTQIRKISGDMQSVTLEHAEHRRRITLLEAGMIDVGKESARLRGDVGDLKIQVTNVVERLHEISTTLARQQSAFAALCDKLDAQHRERIRQTLGLWGLVATIVVLLTAIHQSFTGVPVLESLKGLIGIKP